MFCPEASAAISSHVNWKTSAEMTSESEGVIRWEASIDQGWHIYGLNMPDIDNTVPPTSFTVDTIGGIELIGNVIPDRPATAKVDEVMALKLDQWEGNVTFTQHFRLKAPAKGAAISGIIQYMACSNKVCTPPAKEPFSLTIGKPGGRTAGGERTARTAKADSKRADYCLRQQQMVDTSRC